jgi:aryl-alcohol dehydrogenase-like predicted oxidoreductase
MSGFRPDSSSRVREMIETTELGNTGTTITIHGFGAMPLSIHGRPDEHEAKRTLHAALDAGVNFIDTANVYCLDDDDIGHNEKLIADALLERDDRASIHVATKGGLRRPKGAWVSDAAPDRLRSACERSLRALGTEQIFLYQLHAPDPNVVFEKSVEMLARLQDEGKIRHVGLSNVSVDEIRSAMTLVRVESVQNRFSPWFREAIAEGVIAECDARGLTFLAYSPLGGMRLAKQIANVDVLRDVAAERKTTPVAVCLAWTRARGRRVVPIPGARTIPHAIECAEASGLVLEAEEVARIDRGTFDRSLGL